MDQFPFIYLNHGKITAESFQARGINEVSFILFKNPVSEFERKLIMKDCPTDLKIGCFWSGKFLFFNPVSSETAHEIININFNFDGGNESCEIKADNCVLEKLLSGIPERASFIERWFCKVNAISEIAVCSSPFIPDYEDEWGQWSNDNVYDCGIPVIDGILESNSEIARCNTVESRYFFRIHEYILNFLMINKNK